MSNGFAVLDFEASGLSLSDWPDVSSYPIEVGLAIARPGLPIETWSTLIRPHRAWLSRGEWDRRAARVHGITLAELRDGLSPAEVVALLDEKIAPFGQVWVDGGRYDAHWLDTLCEAALRRPTFALGNLRPMLEIDGEFHARYVLDLARSPAPHRAGPDAERICNALLRAGFLERFGEH